MSENKPKIALVLGAGGNKGFAHLGVIKALEEVGLKPDIVVGSSMGAIIGMCYALGLDMQKIEEKALKLSTIKLLDIKVPNTYGFIKGDKAEKTIRSLLSDKTKEYTFADCKIPFGCVAADLEEATVVELTEGDLIKSVRASFSINGVFQSVKIGKRNLTDGGILCRVPVDLARKMGADIVIGVDCIGKTIPQEMDDFKYIDTLSRIFQIMDYRVSLPEIKRADVLISISQPHISTTKVTNVAESINTGYELTKKKLTEINKKIANYKAK